MPITVQWADEKQTILRYIFEGRWNWDEWYEIFSRGKALVGSVAHRVDAIVDVSNSGLMPTDILSHIKQITRIRSTNLRLVVIVTQSSTARTLYAVAIRIERHLREYYALADTLEEAYAIIAQSRLADASAS